MVTLLRLARDCLTEFEDMLGVGCPVTVVDFQSLFCRMFRLCFFPSSGNLCLLHIRRGHFFTGARNTFASCLSYKFPKFSTHTKAAKERVSASRDFHWRTRSNGIPRLVPTDQKSFLDTDENSNASFFWSRREIAKRQWRHDISVLLWAWTHTMSHSRAVCTVTLSCGVFASCRPPCEKTFKCSCVMRKDEIG